jgi:hypothetical protein
VVPKPKHKDAQKTYFRDGVPAGSTMILRVNFDYAATSIAHFTIIRCYGLFAMSQAGHHCCRVDEAHVFAAGRAWLRILPLSVKNSGSPA